ncbi:MAG: serine hydrolase [Actinobacteria bacterium]|nr:serine hydrolase [Actinomycetota bacterium]
MTDVEELRQIVEQERERSGVAGLSIVVVRDREVVLAEGFGSRDLEHDLPATPQTLFAIASDSKAFTAALCATFVDEGRLEWDAPVRDVLPWFRLQDLHATELVSVRDLLAHRTGLPRHDGAWFWGGATPSKEEMVRRLRHLQPSAPLRQVWQYNNHAYTTAGFIAGELAGSDWETALRDRLLEPLGMKRTTLGRTAAEATGDAAVPYDDRDGTNVAVPQMGDGSVGPAGGIWSNAQEMAQWVLARLGVPLADGSELLSSSALREMHTPAMVKPRTALDLPGLHSLGYALATEIVSYRGHRLVHHGGNLHGFCSDVYLAPEAGHAVVVLANANASGIRTAVPLIVLDQLLSLEKQSWGARLLELTDAVKTGAREASAHHRDSAGGHPPTRPLHDLVGTYSHPAYDVFEINLEGDTLVGGWHDLDTLELRHRDYDSWDVDPIFFALQPADLEPHQLERLAGHYEMGPLSLAVTVLDGALRAEVAGANPLALRPRDATRFEVPASPGARVEFVLDAEGAVERVVVHPIGVFTRTS